MILLYTIGYYECELNRKVYFYKHGQKMKSIKTIDKVIDI